MEDGIEVGRGGMEDCSWLEGGSAVTELGVLCGMLGLDEEEVNFAPNEWEWGNK